MLNRAKLMCRNYPNLQTRKRNIQSRKFYEKYDFYEGTKGINLINEQVSISYH